MRRFTSSAEFRGAEFIDVDLTETVFREVTFAGARMAGVVLANVDIDGYIAGLRINGVEVAPLVEAELNRLHPERAKLRPTTPAGMREAWSVVESLWADTMAQVSTLDAADLRRSVNGEWSFTDTLRHLVFVTDAWFGHAVLGEPRPFHPLALPATFMDNGETFGIDPDADPDFDTVMQVRADRIAQLRAFLADVDQAELDRVREPNLAPGCPPPAPRTASECLYVIFREEWTHRQFALRDLAVITAERT